MNKEMQISRRQFGRLAGLATSLLIPSSPNDENEAKGNQAIAEKTIPKTMQNPQTIKCFCCDLNWSRFLQPISTVTPSAAHDWAFIDPQQYFDWHLDFGNNVMFCQAYTFSGYAFYPTRLGPLAPGPGSQLLPRLYELSQKAGMPFVSYFCVGADCVMSNHRPNWVIPNSRMHSTGHGFLAPESPWTDLFCQRVREFLTQYPVEWLLFDFLVYGQLEVDEALVQPAWFVKQPFLEIIGREMPKSADQIEPAEHLAYKRAVLAKQFRAIRDAVKETSPNTKIGFNVPYLKANEAVWIDHPMLNESDYIFAECTLDDVMEWVLRIRKPHQRIMTTIIGRPDGASDPNSWRKWHARGCDFFGYAWGTPPDFRPLPLYDNELKIVRDAFKEIG